MLSQTQHLLRARGTHSNLNLDLHHQRQRQPQWRQRQRQWRHRSSCCCGAASPPRVDAAAAPAAAAAEHPETSTTAAAAATVAKSTPNTSSTTTSRRSLLLLQSPAAAGAAALALAAVTGTDDAATVINSVLGAYGLPAALRGSGGWRLYDEFGDGYSFEYPRAWVARANTLRPGVIVSDFQTADKAAIEVVDLPFSSQSGGGKGGEDEEEAIIMAAVAAAVAPGGRRDDRLSLPPRKAVKASSALGGVAGTGDPNTRYYYLEFASTTVTSSGYDVRRRTYAVAAARGGKLYALAASARGDKLDAEKERTLRRIVASFQLQR